MNANVHTRLTKYGLRELRAAMVAAAVACALIVAAAWCVWRPLLAVLVVPLAVWAGVVWFFRDPERRIPDEPGVFVSPADGRVTDITPVGPDGPLGRDGVRIGVFMSLFDVHVNRCPDAARVERIQHRPGALLDARDPGASERNESATITMTVRRDGREYPFVVRQIAGLVARRIVTDLSEGDRVARGQRIGMIKFGSRLELLVPRELAAEVRVRVADRVRAGETVLVGSRSGATE